MDDCVWGVCQCWLGRSTQHPRLCNCTMHKHFYDQSTASSQNCLFLSDLSFFIRDKLIHFLKMLKFFLLFIITYIEESGKEIEQDNSLFKFRKWSTYILSPAVILVNGNRKYRNTITVLCFWFSFKNRVLSPSFFWFVFVRNGNRWTLFWWCWSSVLSNWICEEPNFILTPPKRTTTKSKKWNSTHTHSFKNG
jgi:hypothetical protein